MYRSQIPIALAILAGLLFAIVLGAVSAIVLAAPLPGEPISNTLTTTVVVLGAGGEEPPPVTPPSIPTPPVVASLQLVVATSESGGSVKTNEIILDVPAGAVKTDTTFTVIPAEPGTRPTQGTVRVLGKEYVITATDTQGNAVWEFDRPLTLSVPLPPEGDPTDLTIAYWDEALHTWIALPTEIAGGQLIASLQHLTVFAVLDWPDLPRFTDARGHWAEADIVALSGLGAVSGYGDSTYRPEDGMTRAEAVKILVCGLQIAAAPDAALTFTDEVPAWALGYVQAAVKAGVLLGYEDGTFRAETCVTRAEWVLMVIRAGRWQGQAGAEFADTLPTWAAESVRTARTLGLVKGYPDSTFQGNSLLTRAEAAAVVCRAIRLP